MSQAKTEWRCEVRAAQGEEFAIVGTAARFGVASKPIGGAFTEVIDRHAFDRTLADGKNINFCFNHSQDAILARTDNASLKLWTDDSGLQFRAALNRNIQQHRDIYEACKAGLYRECSFAFLPNGKEGERWDGNVRTLLDVNLYDASLVGQPAYPETTASVRSTGTAPTGREALDAIIEEHRRAAAQAAQQSGMEPNAESSVRDRVLAAVANRKHLRQPGDAERRAKAAHLGEQINSTTASETQRERAERLGREIRQETDAFYAARWDSKDEAIAELQDELDDQYGEDRYRALDICPQETRGAQGEEDVMVRGTVICRNLVSEGESFTADDFYEMDEGDYQRNAKSCRKLRLTGKMRSVSPSGTTWQSSQRAISASAAWVTRQEQLESELRMATEAGNHSAIARIKRLRGGK
jgi:HK97 family phage prohead protease